MLPLVLRTLVYFRSLLAPVALGVAVASAVIVGALVVGDSMRGSLRAIAKDRIGRIQSVVIAPRWFPESLSKNLIGANRSPDDVQSLVFIQAATAERESNRANEMSLFGVDPSFWALGSIAPTKAPGDDEVVLNQSLANKLKASIGDLITLRVASQSVVPADSPLGKRDQDTTVLPRWKVVDILEDKSLARFSLRSDQRPVLNAFANLRSLQSALEITEKVNAIFVAQPASSSDSNPKTDTADSNLLDSLAPNLKDMGLTWERIQRRFPEDGSQDADAASASAAPTSNILDYYQVTTDQMLIGTDVANEIVHATQSQKPSEVLTYLANGIQRLSTNQGESEAAPAGRNVPYSTISAADWSILSQMLAASGSPTDEPKEDNWTVINSWLANELNAKVGDRLRIEYFLPETVDGEEVEQSFELVVAAIAPLTEPQISKKRGPKGPSLSVFDAPPTPFNDAAWTPTVPGITDQESMDDWDTPFPLTRKREKQDDTYWDAHRLTPKLFVSSQLGKKVFGSRFGECSSIRYDKLEPSQAATLEQSITQAARKSITGLGWRNVQLKQQQMQAANGTTPFDALFLSLSFFVIVAALLLVALLFRLAIEQRADHWGLLLASGWTRNSVRRLLLLEGGVVSGIGATLGVPLGLAYAYAMIAGLRTWWIGAISVSFLEYYAQPTSLVIGWLLGWLSALGTVFLSTRQLKDFPIARLLKGQMERSVVMAKLSAPKRVWLPIACVTLAALILLVGQFQQGQAQAGAFVGAGMFVLIGGIAWAFRKLKSVTGGTSSSSSESMLNASSFAASNAKRAPLRSILAIGLVAIASFLILSMSLFQSAPDEAGTGRFTFLAKSAHAIHKDLGKLAYQREIVGNEKAAMLQGWDVVPFRVRGGDDASCNNLYQASEPQVLGISPRMDQVDRTSNKDRSAFAWFSTQALQSGHTPWNLLESKADGSKSSPIPVVLDQNTALWALHLGGYAGEVFSYKFDGHQVYFQTAGVLQNTVLQGSLIVGESNFESLFPSVTGHRLFLIKPRTDESNGPEAINQVREVLENGWAESGLSLAFATDILKQLMAVQNTYLSAFQVLGGLGLLLGTIGLGVVQLRSAMERRSELAAMRAIGFTKSRLIWLLTLENTWQLVRGVGIGIAASVFAATPAILNGQPFSGMSWPFTMVLIVMVTGLVCSYGAAWSAMRWPLLSALRATK